MSSACPPLRGLDDFSFASITEPSPGAFLAARREPKKKKIFRHIISLDDTVCGNGFKQNSYK